MTSTRPAVWIGTAVLGVLCGLSSGARAQGLFTPGEPIRPIEVRWTQDSQVVPAQLEEPAPLHIPESGPVVPPRSVVDVAGREPLTAHRDRQREDLKEALADGGQSASQQRDDLTVEVLNVTRWTSAILVLGTVAAFVLKRYGKTTWQKPTGLTGAMRIVESVPVGRTGGLHLVSIGEERLVVAADHTGIKAMTLLPSWPAEES